jgi:hypothetical protein
MGCGIRYATSILASDLGELNTLALSFAACLIVIAGHLQGQFEQELLHRFQNNPGNTVGISRKIG